MRTGKREINWCESEKGLGKVKSEEKRERKGVGRVIHNILGLHLGQSLLQGHDTFAFHQSTRVVIRRHGFKGMLRRNLH